MVPPAYRDPKPRRVERSPALLPLVSDPGPTSGTPEAAYADHSPQDLLARARHHLHPTGLTALFGGRIALTDGLIHHQDIRRALGILREVPAERVLAALRFAPGAPPIGAAKRLRGLSFAATDLAWTTGKGPAVEGPGEALLMAMAGRPAALPELSGPGLATLAARIEARPG